MSRNSDTGMIDRVLLAMFISRLVSAGLVRVIILIFETGLISDERQY
ncbi:hypothetical protein [Methanospirillum sp.]|nr:hypothetical protein [Methanospirillum sp.]